MRRASACQLVYGLPRLATWKSTWPCVLRPAYVSAVAVVLMSSLVVACWCSRSRWLQLLSHPGMYCLLKPRGMLFFATHISMLQYAEYVVYASSAGGFGRPGVLLSVSAVNISQLAFRKFHLLTGSPAIGWTSDGTLMIDGRWCDRGIYQ